MDSEDRIKAHFRLAAGEPASADDLVLSRLRRDAEAAARRRRLVVIGGGIAAAAAVVAGVLLYTRTDSDRLRVVPPAQTSTTPSTSTTTTVLDAQRPAALSALDWDNVKYDLGIITGIQRAENGTWRLTFDRVALYTDDGTKDAKDFTEEPVVYGNTGVETENTNSRLRDYRVLPSAEVLEVGNFREACPFSSDNPPPPRWERRSLERLVDEKLYVGNDQTALTFNAAGFVTRIRLSKAC